MVLLDEIRDWFGNVVVGRWPRRSLRVRPGVVEPLEVRALLATFTVSNLNDAGDGSLRKAISDANGSSGADAIEFMAGIRGTMPLTSGQMTISDSLTITGPGVDSLTFSANNTGNRILLIDNANASLINVSISAVTIRDAGDGGATIINGGAISNAENLTLTNVDFISNHSGVSGHSGALAHSNGALLITSCQFTDNNAGVGGGGAIGIFSGTATITGSTLSDNATTNSGGAIYVAGGTVEILQSTISGNTAVSGGGGIVNESTAGVLVQNSTISGNSAGLSGGGVFNGGPLTIRNSTITNNTNDHSGGVYSQNITPQQLIIRNSIIASNKQTNGTPTDLRGTTPTISNSLVGVNTDTSLQASATPDINGNFIGSSTAINPQLGPLTFNGGPTQTHALLTGSPAIDRGNNTSLNGLTTDQRGNPVARIANSIVDMGAYELFTISTPLIVSTTTDELDGNISSGDLSLREAIVLANSSQGVNSITFAASTNNVEFDLTLGQMEISETVTITGNGSSTTSIDAQQKSRIFTVSSGDVTLNNLTLKNGRVANGPGGAILSISTGTLTISQSTLADNSATGYGHGGGAIMTLTGAVTINRSTLSGNSTGGVTAEGGAIKSESGAVTISNSTLSENRTTNTDSNGGAVYANSGSITISQSTLSGNFTAQTLAHGGAVFGYTGNIVISQSTLTQNTATNAKGGAIFSSSSPLTIRNSIVAGNTDAATAADVRKSPDGGDAFTVTNSLIGRNNGTGLTPTSGSTPDANDNFIGGNNAGAAINPQLGPLAFNGGPTQTHALLTGSSAINRGSNTLLNGLTTDQRGTPVARITDTTVDMGAYELFTLANPIVVSTTTDELDGNISSGRLSLREAIVLANSSPGMNTITFAASTNNTEFDLTLGQMEISETVTINGNGSSTTIIDAQQNSRIFDITGTAAVTLASLMLKNGRTTGSNADFTDTTFSGAAVRSLSSGTLTISQSIVSGNSTTGNNANGGGIFAYSGAVTLSGSTVSGNSTAGDDAYGGGIYARSGAVTLTSSTVSVNTTAESSADGGGIFTNSGGVTLINSTVSGNSTAGSSADGGGIFANSGGVTLINSTVSGNSTAGSSADGGGIFSSSGVVTLTNSTASGNTTAGSTAHGGGIFSSSAAVTLTHSTVSGNTTAGNNTNGGGIYSRSGAVTLTNSTVSGNQVTGTDSDGGGVWFDDSVVTIVNGTLTSNSASRAGGGLKMFVNNTDKKLTIHNSIIAGNTAASIPDFMAPTNPTTNLEVRHSMIGRSDGTTLTATVGITPNLNGNLIGGSTDGTKIDPLLAPLANNGGPTQTHALQNNSPAFNRGNDTLAVNMTLPVSTPLITDQRGAGFARNLFGIVDMGPSNRPSWNLPKARPVTMRSC